MKQITAFLRLIRWPNLLFIALTQILFVYCIVKPLYVAAGKVPVVHGKTFFLLCLSSVLVAAAGYIINDYFDLNIDRINKPEKLVVEKIIPRRWTIVLHLALSAVGILIGFYIDFTTPILFLGLANAACVLFLFVYSISLKKKLLAGNILISLLTAWVVLVITWCEVVSFPHIRGVDIAKLSRYTFLYAGFAFIISIIREVIKDMEDIEGDRKYGCTTMPIVWGVHASKIFVAVWLVVLIGILTMLQFYVLAFKWWVSAVYCIVFIIAPLINILRDLFKANAPKDFHRLSTLVKLVMFTGILSIIFIKFYS
ncbi:ubiquinone biosynthesis protein UbiA [Ilyomonas limi]|uniref:Ubiquinone biosynthesis protein UbiA n=1 Tax=Ilyomonas limi TaxID=2575867 RepID=A0A4U3L6E8_9BACT|nr:geranylgeranylglycerol-phosphate geranylgeranyltransferase [Ilyomonas limi]TKK70808.1 ubiquinone biosynthesis protein UbiA [Ilyomonas limi]